METYVWQENIAFKKWNCVIWKYLCLDKQRHAYLCLTRFAA